MATVINQGVKISDLDSITSIESGDLLYVAEKNNTSYTTKKIDASYFNNLRTTASNLGSNGAELYEGSIGGTSTPLVLRFRKIIAGDDITITQASESITISAPTALKLATNTEILQGISTKAISPSGLNSIKTSLNMGDFLVERDYYGNFEANIITASLDGNASTATRLETPTTIRLIGDVTGSAVTDLSGDVNISTTLNGTTSPGVPAGTVIMYASNTVPAGYVACDGGTYSRIGTYANLFAAIGTQYGAPTTGTFQVPDLRGYFVRGYGTNTDSTASGGFGTKQTDSFKSHQHHIGNNSFSNQPGESTRYGLESNNTPFGTESFPHLTKTTGDDETRPKNIALLYCIRY